ncbi:MAG: hypothetical protein R6U50_18590 [Desulfobacterales bacterium]
MKKVFFVLAAAILIFGMSGPAMSQDAQNGTQAKDSNGSAQTEGWFCPWCGSPMGERGMGPGMMHGRDMKQRGGYYHHGWSRGTCPRAQMKRMKPMTEADIRGLMENYVAGNPNLKVGEITEKEDTYVAEVVTRDDSLVEKIIVDKNTGYMKRSF